MSITLIVAASNNNVIGINGTIPWHIPEDMQYFRKKTKHKAIVMGRRTWESLPKKPLDNRTNIILTTDKNYEAQGAVVAHSIEDALNAAVDMCTYGYGTPDIFVIGGEKVYEQFIDVADEILYTRVDMECEGDSFFPIMGDNWELSHAGDLKEYKGIKYSFNVYINKNIHLHISDIYVETICDSITARLINNEDNRFYTIANECLDANLFMVPLKLKPDHPCDDFLHYSLYKRYPK